MLEDGSYDVIVVDAEDGTDGPTIRVELTVISGVHKGELVSVTASGLGRDPLDLLANPGTLVVVDGVPALSLEA